MVNAALKALGDVLSLEFRSVLWKALGLTLVLFFTLLAGVEAIFYFLTLLPYPWLETSLAFATGLGLLVLFFFLMAPVTAMFAGLYLDDVAAKVEARHYASQGLGKPLTLIKGLLVSLQFGLLVLFINVLALPFIFTGIGALVLITINAYLLSRQYFEMAAARFMEVEDAKQFRKDNGLQVFLAGYVPALMALVPVLNLIVPLFATSYFVHLFKRVQKSSV